MLKALTNNVDARCMIDVIYFNDSHQENHNIELYKNNSFSNVMNIDLAHNQMICKMVKLFMDKILEEDMDHNLHYYNKTKSETVKLLSKHIYSQILSRTLQKITYNK
jgi:transposase-like protein